MRTNLSWEDVIWDSFIIGMGRLWELRKGKNKTRRNVAFVSVKWNRYLQKRPARISVFSTKFVFCDFGKINVFSFSRERLLYLIYASRNCLYPNDPFFFHLCSEFSQFLLLYGWLVLNYLSDGVRSVGRKVFWTVSLNKSGFFLVWSYFFPGNASTPLEKIWSKCIISSGVCGKL